MKMEAVYGNGKDLGIVHVSFGFVFSTEEGQKERRRRPTTRSYSPQDLEAELQQEFDDPNDDLFQVEEAPLTAVA